MVLNTPKTTPPESVNVKSVHQREDVMVSIPPFNISSADLPKNVKDETQITREEFLDYGVPLYKAALDGDWKKAKRIFDLDNKWLTAKITKYEDTALHIAAAAMHLDFVKKLAKLMYVNNDQLDSPNFHGNTAFCNAAVSGNIEIAKVMVEINEDLPNIRGAGIKQLTPLHMAILFGKRDMVNYLKEKTKLEKLTDMDRIELLTSAIEAGLYDIALYFIEKYPHLALERNSKKETVLHTLAAQRPLQNSTRKQSRWRKLLRRCDKEKEQRLEDSLEVTRRTWKEVIRKEKDLSFHMNEPWRLLFVAAKRGNVGFLRTLISIYPDVIWKIDEKTRSIFHIAVIYRHEEIFKLIHEFGTIKDIIAAYKDDQGNTMLHLAAKLAPPDRLNCVSGAALQMQRELLWFEAVKKVVPPQYALAKNHERKIVLNDGGESENNKNTREFFKSSKKDEDRSESFKSSQSDEDRSGSFKSNQSDSEDRSESFKSVQNDEENSESKNEEDYIESDNEEITDFRMTPRALFTKEHEDLRSRGEGWMKKTAESCTLVATLITTVNFTAAFTLPGGNDQNKGYPLLLNQPWFKVFAVSNAISLFASSTSIFMFLSILTSRYAENDFLEVLPRKLMAGLTSLLISVATMMAAFTATFFITFSRNPIWIPAPVPVLAAFPVVLFLYQQFPLLWDIHCSKNQSWTLIQPSDKRTLFWSKKRPKIMSSNGERPSYFTWRGLHNKSE